MQCRNADNGVRVERCKNASHAALTAVLIFIRFIPPGFRGALIKIIFINGREKINIDFHV